jgi:hypothetical protein
MHTLKILKYMFEMKTFFAYIITRNSAHKIFALILSRETVGILLFLWTREKLLFAEKLSF